MDNERLSFTVLGSSSSGNSSLISFGGQNVLIDAGLPLNYTRRIIKDLTTKDGLDAIFISHEHSDHIKGLKTLSKAYRAPIYASRSVGFLLDLHENARIEELRDRRCVDLDGLRITPFQVPHDALEPFGFIIEGGGSSIGIATDLGSAEGDVVEVLRDRDALVIESNYDPDMLMRGPYQYSLKRRIMNINGHLSNVQCRDLITRTIGERTREIVLAHLSEENNDPLLAMECCTSAIRDREITNLRLSYPRIPTPRIFL
ncbi:MAG: MBL fold metallo-hydrolase [Candidatus Thermoplasmatota archaeon]|nr:MBL fold metallo-hydrolase [Candidatus Thermoplasmatota archaeon]